MARAVPLDKALTQSRERVTKAISVFESAALTLENEATEQRRIASLQLAQAQAAEQEALRLRNESEANFNDADTTEEQAGRIRGLLGI